MELETQNALFKITSRQGLIMFLIRKELKIAKFIHELGKLGFDATTFSFGLGEVILSLKGFHNPDDELWNWYYELLDIQVEKVMDLKDSSIFEELALELYVELCIKLKTE